MKKVSIFMAIAAAASLASCTAQAPKANLKSDIDSLSYSIGMAQTQGPVSYTHLDVYKRQVQIHNLPLLSSAIFPTTGKLKQSSCNGSA